MSTLRNLVLTGVVLSLTLSSVWADPAAKTEMTVYNQGIALVRQVQPMTVTIGVSKVPFENIPTQIDPTSVHFKSLTDPNGTRVLEQNYDYDLVGKYKLLQKCVGQPITISWTQGDMTFTKTGLLLSAEGDNLVFKEDSGQILLVRPETVRLEKLPENLILKPTLNWLLSAQRGGSHDIELAYITRGMSWTADYVVVLGQDERNLDITGWVTMTNNSGKSFEDAKLKLMAGDVNVEQPNRYARKAEMVLADGLAYSAAAPQFTEKSFADYHLYTLGRPATVLNNQTKQIELNNAYEVPYQKIYVYDGVPKSGWFYSFEASPVSEPNMGSDFNKKVVQMIEFKNDEMSKMGMPLPAGKIRVYQQDKDGSQEFIGEDRIDHTPKDEKIRVTLGNAFDVVGERRQSEFKVLVPGHSVSESFEIKLRNHKDTDVTVKVPETLYRWSEWEIRNSSHSFTKIDSRHIEYNVKVPKDGETVITYTVIYNW